MPNKTVIITNNNESKRVSVSSQDAAALTGTIIHLHAKSQRAESAQVREVATTGWTHTGKTELQIEDEA